MQKFAKKTSIQGHSKQKATIGIGHNYYVCTNKVFVMQAESEEDEDDKKNNI